MININLSDKRLDIRYNKLLKSHMKANNKLSTGIKAIPSLNKSQSLAQSLWRFLDNPKSETIKLNQPIIDLSKKEANTLKHKYLLVMHDWSRINFRNHTNKKDKLQMSHDKDMGYDLQNALLVNSTSGVPIAPIFQNMQFDKSTLSTISNEFLESKSHLDELSIRLEEIKKIGYKQQLIHIADREADSIGHLREWHSNGHLFLIRCKQGNKEKFNGIEQKLKDVGGQLKYRQITIDCISAKNTLLVSEAMVEIIRPEKHKKIDLSTQK